MKEKLLGSTIEELRTWCQDNGHKAFHANQIIEWVYQKRIYDISKMTNLSLAFREKLAESYEPGLPKLVRVQESNDHETTKFLWQLEDGKLVESVLIRSFERRTVCVSSQVGCPARCAFCASGRQGLIRNLEVYEIVSQVYQIDEWLMQKGERVSHVVYMGMGEPFRNYDNVVQSIRFLTHPEMMNISQRRITVSTVGVVEGIKRFTDEGIKTNLVLSLHAPNQRLRQKIIPYARQYALDDILESMYAYSNATGRDVTFEYTLLAGLNDQPEHAEELAKLVLGKQCTINLIPYNPVDGLRLKRPDHDTILAFRKILHERRIVNTCRYTKGDDIAAACGQLAMQQESPLLKVVNG